MKPFFSIVIPTLNEERYLPLLLGDLIAQSESDFEVFVVDGASEDQTQEKASDFKDRLRLSFFQNERRNVAYQRNFGASKAQGTYVVFLDADVRIDADFLKSIKDVVSKRKYLLMIPTIVVESDSFIDHFLFRLTNYVIRLSQKIGSAPLSASGSMILERGYFLFIGGFDESLYIAEDHEIVQRAKSYGVAARILGNVKLQYSLRRFEKEGRVKLLLKTLVAHIHIFLRGSIRKEIFEYKMGGDHYATDSTDST